MVDLPRLVVGEAYQDSVAWQVLTDLTAVGNRMAGQAGEAHAAEVVANHLDEVGANEVDVKEFELPGWWRGESSLTVDQPRERTYGAEHDLLALPGSPSGSVEGPLVDVGYGTDQEIEDADLEGAIALVRSDTPEDSGRWRHRMEKYASVVEAGGEGFVFRNHVPGCLPPTGEVGYHDRPGEVPAVGVSKELGDRLARTCQESEVKASLNIECRNEPTTSRNVSGAVGPDTKEEVLVTAHVDAHDVAEGANDNGAGSAIVVEIGRLLASIEDRLDTKVRLITFGSEEIGLYGAYHWAETHDLENVRAVINVDGAGNSRTLRIGTNGFADLEAVFESVCDRLDVPLETDDTVSPHGDQWAFVEHGVPGVMASSVSDQEGRGWGHTHADTLDKLDPRDLREIAILLAAGVFELTNGGHEIEHEHPQAIRNELSSGYTRELKVGGRWHFDH